jgi:hypothetical protein
MAARRAEVGIEPRPVIPSKGIETVEFPGAAIKTPNDADATGESRFMSGLND